MQRKARAPSWKDGLLAGLNSARSRVLTATPPPNKFSYNYDQHRQAKTTMTGRHHDPRARRGDHGLLRGRPGHDRLALPDVRPLARGHRRGALGERPGDRGHPPRGREGGDGRHLPDPPERLPVRRAGRGHDQQAAAGPARGLLQGPRLREPLHEPQRGRASTPGSAGSPPAHFTARRIELLRESVQRTRRRAGRRHAPQGRRRRLADIKQDLANKLPVRVIVDMLGVPQSRPRADLGVVGGGRAAVLPRRALAARGRRGDRRVPRVRRRARSSGSARPARDPTWPG